MSTCQIEVLEFGQAMKRPWVRNRLQGVIKPEINCVCGCPCCEGSDFASLYNWHEVDTYARKPH